MKDAVIYIHGKGGSAQESEHYRPLFPDADVTGFDYKAQSPWEAAEEFPPLFDAAVREHSSVTVIANSIGAFFAMTALADKPIDRAFFISPVVDMEKLITDMMKWAGATEDELRLQREIITPFGETLSWEYLCYVREHPIHWQIPTHILYGEKDELTASDTIAAFSERTGATLTVMKNGEHWFHTGEQMKFLDNWLTGLSGKYQR
ncbi:MAG: alpha/beta hydrolase [Oscillospiraceae bacterium]|nr:alpha/beta hydrolase [Oscillospiraceae bacterium]